MRDVVVIAHDIRSCHNVGSLFRTAEALGARKIYCTGYTPYPETLNDTRLPHISRKIQLAIQKTALGADTFLAWEYWQDLASLLAYLKSNKYKIIALEQAPNSVTLTSLKLPDKVALLLGREVEGIASDFLALADVVAEIPMFGKKESLNVVQAAAIALYEILRIK
ncbi:MAG: RNA methyltransferase [Candidatus Saccharimonadales bacterium]